MIRNLLLFICLSLLIFACDNNTQTATEENKSAEITIKNALDSPRKDALLHLDISELGAKVLSILDGDFKIGTNGTTPFQKNDLDGDGQIDQIAVLVNLAPNEEKTLNITPLANGEEKPSFQKRTQAEISHKINGTWKDREYQNGEFKNVDYLRVPPEHTDHSWFIRYEGPGWESDMVGYRFYLDWRNATDIFGKKTTDMVLQDVGQDGFDSYHEPSDWGMDVLKVGSSLGIGALGSWVSGQAERVEKTDSLSSRIVLNGPIESKVQTKYYGWEVDGRKTNVTSNLSIHAGSRLTKHEVVLSEALPNLCTGIVKHENGDFFKYENGAYGYIATWGKQSLADDHLGMAVIYRKNDIIEITEDEHSHVVVLSPSNKNLTYYFLGAWEQEPNAIQTQEAFVNYLKEVITALEMPVSISI